jgi:hypothetical protein
VYFFALNSGKNQFIKGTHHVFGKGGMNAVINGQIEHNLSLLF